MTNILDKVQAAQKAASNAQATRARAEYELTQAEASRQVVAEQLKTEFGITIDQADAALATLEQKLLDELVAVETQLTGTVNG